MWENTRLMVSSGDKKHPETLRQVRIPYLGMISPNQGAIKNYQRIHGTTK
jgi:hypothetical protein